MVSDLLKRLHEAHRLIDLVAVVHHPRCADGEVGEFDKEGPVLIHHCPVDLTPLNPWPATIVLRGPYGDRKHG